MSKEPYIDPDLVNDRCEECGEYLDLCECELEEDVFAEVDYTCTEKKDKLYKLLEPYTVVLKDFIQLDNTPFRLNAFNGVYAPAKAGKTYFVLEQLNTLDTQLYHIVWLDGDRNSELKDKFENIHHFPLGNPSEALKMLIGSEYNYDDYIFVIDSFKDFTLGQDTDTNKGSQRVLEVYQQLLNKGATLVIIFHATKTTDNYHQDFKLKGNADTIESKMDFLYKLERTDEYAKLTVQCARDVNLRVGEELIFCDRDILKKKITEVISSKEEITLRDLKRESGISTYASIIDEFKDIVFEVIEVKPEGRGKPKHIVKLL
jgi:hypothetical protein